MTIGWEARGTIFAQTDHPKVLEIVTSDCVAEDFAGEIVVLNIVSGVYFSIRDLAAAVWRDLAAGQPVESLIEGLGGIDEEIAEKVAGFIDELEDAGLMRRRNSRPVQSRELESIALVCNGETRLTFQSFEDMKDLILADPIHDAEDDKGWPVLRHTELA
jgi:coenzyme PQQ synthesis protein D (PqqD)